MTVFSQDSDGAFLWRRPLRAYLFHGISTAVVFPVALYVALAQAIPSGNVPFAAFCFGLMLLVVIHVSSWKLALTKEGLIVSGSLFKPELKVQRIDVHAISVTPMKPRTPRLVLLAGERLRSLPNTELLPDRDVDALARELAEWAGCEVVSRNELTQLRLVRSGQPVRGYVRRTTRTS